MKHTEKSKAKMVVSHLGQKNRLDKFKPYAKYYYNSLHIWIRKKLGDPDTCEHCGKTGLKGKKIHWANKSKKYRRSLSDWLRLCVPCHYKFDHPKNNI